MQICDQDCLYLSSIQTNLLINPATLLPGAVPLISGGVSVLPGLVPAASLGGLSHSPSPSLITRSSVSPILTPVGGAQAATGEGVNFDSPAQVTTLQSANKVGHGSVLQFSHLRKVLAV